MPHHNLLEHRQVVTVFLEEASGGWSCMSLNLSDRHSHGCGDERGDSGMVMLGIL